MTVTFGAAMVSTPIALSCSHSSHAFIRRASNVVGYNLRSSLNRRCFKRGLCMEVHDLWKPQNRIWILRATVSDESIPTESSESTETKPEIKFTLEDIPKRTLHQLTVKGHKLKPEVIIGSKGLETGVLTSILQHLNRRDVVRVKVSRACKVETADIAKDLEQKSGGLVISVSGPKIILYKGDLASQIPPKDTEQEQNE